MNKNIMHVEKCEIFLEIFTNTYVFADTPAENKQSNRSLKV